MDRFSISFEQSSISLAKGETATIELNRSWYNDDLKFETLSCTVTRFEYEPEGIVEIDPETLEMTAISVGTATVRAVVTGGGGIKTATMTAIVNAN